MLGGESEEGGDPQRDPGGDSLRFDPEADPGHHHDQTRGNVGVKHEVTQPPPKLELDHQTREVTCKMYNLALATLSKSIYLRIVYSDKLS